MYESDDVNDIYDVIEVLGSMLSILKTASAQFLDSKDIKILTDTAQACKNLITKKSEEETCKEQ